MIPFYGADDPELFRIERAAMDRAGLVVRALDRTLPVAGLVADVGAGNGHTARLLGSTRRTVVAVEPSQAMLGSHVDLPAVVGMAQHLPFATASLDGLYATWAYFFPTFHDMTPGLREAHRAVTAGGPICIVDNAGDDEFTALAGRPIASDPVVWEQHGFDHETIETAFEFDSLDDARRLLGHFFGETGLAGAALSVTFNVALYRRSSQGAESSSRA